MGDGEVHENGGSHKSSLSPIPCGTESTTYRASDLLEKTVGRGFLIQPHHPPESAASPEFRGWGVACIQPHHGPWRFVSSHNWGQEQDCQNSKAFFWETTDPTHNCQDCQMFWPALPADVEGSFKWGV